ncbi:MAG: BrnA antitoxin family protein [Gallionella sp.]
MTGSKTTLNNRKAILNAVKIPPAHGDYEWDGKDEADRPLTREELQAGIAEYRRGRGRPAGSGKKEQVAIRFDSDVLAALRESGKGWQTRVNDVMREWLKSHRST